MNSKLIGGILLVTGTTIGAGMLALPIATAQLGFWGSLVLLISGWAIMMASAYLFLEVNLWLPANTNLISMAGATLGKGGQAVTWVVYLLLMYSILSAYTAGGGDLFHYVLTSAHLDISRSMSSVLFTSLFGLVVYFGIRAVDYVNRGLMLGKMGSYLILVVLILPFISPTLLDAGEFKNIVSPTSITVTALAFGNLIIIPSLRTYFGSDVKSLRKAIFIGTLIPLVCYIAWDLVTLGVIPLQGLYGFDTVLKSSDSNSALLIALTHILQKGYIANFAKFFTSICMATSFLSVALSLSDFLSDGLKIKKQGVGSLVVAFATFLPPLCIVLWNPGIFMRGLNYGGLCCLILMVLLPALMVWRGRYSQQLNIQNNQMVQQMRGGKVLLAGLMIFATVMIGFGFNAV